MSVSLRFADLFAGLGGFHVALKRLGHRCVYSCELDPALRALYKENHGLLPDGDITCVDPATIPSHDILCAGFPCQPFSKAGDQLGYECPKQGKLFEKVATIVAAHRPTYLMLENVPNFERHEGGKTFEKLYERLTGLGYEVKSTRLSPHQFGIPQIRDRVFIVAQLGGLGTFDWPKKPPSAKPDLRSILDVCPITARPLSSQVVECLEVWQKFVQRFPADEELPSFPIWSMEFGASYPYEKSTPFASSRLDLQKCFGSHGVPLRGLTKDAIFAKLPSHARIAQEQFPVWKVQFIRQNREFYMRHRRWIDRWMPQILRFPPSLQKLEWNCKGEERDIWKYVLQFRASGVRVKRPQTAPSLIAMTVTQVPIIGWERRYMTARECARLQSLDSLANLPASDTGAYKALGNAVNAQLVEKVAANLVGVAKLRRLSTSNVKSIRQFRLNSGEPTNALTAPTPGNRSAIATPSTSASR